jgi:23S rRNA pseudouridine2457 synthase
MTAAVGFPTLRLLRIAVGPIGIGELKPGEWRDLAPAELKLLFSAVKISRLPK